MHLDRNRPPDPATPKSALIGRLLNLADDMDRAGLRREASVLVAMVYSVLDGQ